MQVFEQCLKYVWQPANPYLDFKHIISKTIAAPAADLVNFTLYYETLCPDCREFVSGQLWKAFNAVGHIMNLTLVPYGNARVVDLIYTFIVSFN